VVRTNGVGIGRLNTRQRAEVVGWAERLSDTLPP
jgi:hypothetical protein